MKKKWHYIYSGILSIALCTSCEKASIHIEPEVSDQKIEFSAPSIQVETKSGPINEFPDNTKFGVLGYCLAQTAPDNETLNESSGKLPWEQKKALSRPHLFYNTPVTYKDGKCSYENEVKWYESIDYLYTFFAYYPHGTESGFSLLTNDKSLGAPKIKFSMPFVSSDVNTDLDPTQVPDAMVADECFDITKAGGNVKLDFRHILTGLNFNINNYNETTPVEIHYLKLSGNFYKSVEITLGESVNYSEDTYSGTFHLLKDTEEPVIVKPHTPHVKQGEHEGNAVVGPTLLLMPSGGAGKYLGDLKLTIGYKFNYDDNQDIKEQTFGRPENFLPEPGTIYSAQLNFIGNAFVLEFIIDNESKWEDGGDSDITFG